MKSDTKLVLLAVLVGIVVNLVLPFALKPLATQDQIKPPNGAENLPFFDQLMHMFVHHAQVPLTSSLIVAVIVLVSVCLALCLKKYL